VHLGNGLWGIVAVGLWARPSLLEAAYGLSSHPGLFFATEGSNLLPAQLVGGLFILGWTAVTMLPFFVALDYFQWFRVNELEEFVGLDAMYSSNTGNAHNTHLCLDEESSTNEDLRRMAYSQRLAEKQQKKQTGKSRKMTLSELLTVSAYGTAPSDEWLRNKKSKSKRKGDSKPSQNLRPEQAPRRNKSQAPDRRNKEPKDHADESVV
jgi:Ammonium Transporter Family